MPYQFGEFVSTYRDPQSVKIAETLRNRYMENLQANDQVAMALEQMKAALPFENDMAKKAELQKNIEDKLQSFVDRGGNYEDLGPDIRLVAKQFSTEYKPIQENYDRYQGALQTLSKQLESGDINASQYNLATNYIIRGYKGFEVDPTTGKVVEGSMFSAPTIYKDPKLLDMIEKKLNGLHEEVHGEEVISSGLDANGVWKSTSATKVSTLSKERVMEVYNSVMQQPDAQMYLQQTADMKLAMVEDSGNTGAYLDAKIKTNQSAIDELNKELEGNKYSAQQKKIITSQIDSFTKENETLSKAKVDPNLAQSVLKDTFINELVEPVKGFALATSYRSVETKRGFENNYQFIIDAERRRQDRLEKLNESLFTLSDVYANNDISGATTAEKQEFIKNANAQIVDLERQLQDTTLSQAGREELENAMINAKRNRDRAQYQITEAANRAISMADLEKQDPTLIGIFKDKMKGASSGDIYTAIEKTFDNIGDTDYLEFKTVFDGKYGAGALDRHITKYYGGATSDAEAIKRAYPNVSDAELASRGILNSPTRLINTFKKFESKVNERYAEIKESRLYGERVQTGDDDLDIATSAQLKEYFVGKPISENSVVTMEVDGKMQQVSGAELAEQGKEFKVNMAQFDPLSNSFQLQLVGKDGVVKTALLDGQYIKGTGLSAALNRPAVRLGSTIMAMNSHVAGTTRDIKDVKFQTMNPDGTVKSQDVLIRVHSRGDDNPYVSFHNTDGSPYLEKDGEPVDVKYLLNDPALKKFLETNVTIKGL